MAHPHPHPHPHPTHTYWTIHIIIEVHIIIHIILHIIIQSAANAITRTLGMDIDTDSGLTLATPVCLRQ